MPKATVARLGNPCVREDCGNLVPIVENRTGGRQIDLRWLAEVYDRRRYYAWNSTSVGIVPCQRIKPTKIEDRRSKSTMALRKLFVSALWLALVQFLNIVLPVMTVPVVTRAFGPTMFGLLATISALAGYVGLLATFGFNLTGPRATAVLRGEPSKLSAVISNILSAQAVLGAIGTV